MARSSYRANITCPVCHYRQVPKLGSRGSGLVKCQHCQACLVVSWSGHYVRDPFGSGRGVSLRAFSRPHHASRHRGQLSRPSVVIILGSLLVTGVALSNLVWGSPSLIYDGFNLQLPSADGRLRQPR